eukprot:Sdes_comp18486_c1_seq2m8484
MSRENEPLLLRDVVYVPPLNFSMVIPGVYRSGYPNKKNFPFLRKLKLKCIIFMDEEKYLEENEMFVKSENIKFYQFPVQRNKEPFIQTEYSLLNECLALLLDQEYHPLLIHCNKGKVTTLLFMIDFLLP